MASVPVTTARANLYKLIGKAASTHKPIHISGKKASAVLVSEDDWSAIQETLYLASIPGMRDSIRKGLKTPISKTSKTLKW